MQVKSVKDYENKSGIKFKGDTKYLVYGFCNNKSCERIRNDFAQHTLLAFINIENNNILYS